MPDDAAAGDESKTLLAAANRVLRGEIASRAQLLAAAPDGDFALTPDRAVTWRGGAVGRLLRGDTALAPKVEALPGDFLEGDAARERAPPACRVRAPEHRARAARRWCAPAMPI